MAATPTPLLHVGSRTRAIARTQPTRTASPRVTVEKILERPRGRDADERDEDDEHRGNDAGSPGAHDDEEGWPKEVELLLDGQAPGVPEQAHRGAGRLDPVRDVEKRSPDAEGDRRPSAEEVNRKDEGEDDQKRWAEAAYAAAVEGPEVDAPSPFAFSDQERGDEPSGKHEEDRDADIAPVERERQLRVA